MSVGISDSIQKGIKFPRWILTIDTPPNLYTVSTWQERTFEWPDKGVHWSPFLQVLIVYKLKDVAIKNSVKSIYWQMMCVGDHLSWYNR